MTLMPDMRRMKDEKTNFTVTDQLKSVAREDDLLGGTIGSDYSELTKKRSFDQIVVNHGTIPLDDIYFDLKHLSSNLGAVDQAELLAGKAQSVCSNTAGKFQLFRIGDAVSARNTHAAIYDALRLMKDI